MATPPKPTVSDDDEPLTVLVLFGLAGLSLVLGIVAGMAEWGGLGLFAGVLTGAAAGSGAWISGLALRLLYRIERNTRPRR